MIHHLDETIVVQPSYQVRELMYDQILHALRRLFRELDVEPDPPG
jgi:hypothetical protein